MQGKLSVSKAKAELCRRSLYEFLQEFWDVIIPEDPVWNWHIKYICDELQKDLLRICRLPAKNIIFEGEKIQLPAKPRQKKQHDILVNVPPGSSKSTIITIMAPAWLWTNDATLRIISASYAGDLSQDHAVKSRDIIQSDKYRSFFPEVEIRADSNNKNNYKNTAGGERYATSVGGTIMGIHAHLILIDDPLNTKQSVSESELPLASSFVNTTLSTRKVDKAVTLTIMVMQRLHELDPSGDWLRKRDNEGKKLKHICLPARLSDRVYPPELAARYTDGLLDPVRMDNEVLAAAAVELGSYSFAGQMGQNPAPDDGGIWKRWFIPVPDKDFPTQDQLQSFGYDWDTAYTDKKTNAASAFVGSGRIDKRMYIDSVGWFWKIFPDLINVMKLMSDGPHYVEAKASGKSAVQTLITAGIPAFEVQVNADKKARANDATPKAEAGLVFVRASILDKIYNDPEQGILKFPNGVRADLADTIAQAIQRHLGKPKREIVIGWRALQQQATQRETILND